MIPRPGRPNLNPAEHCHQFVIRGSASVGQRQKLRDNRCPAEYGAVTWCCHLSSE